MALVKTVKISLGDGNFAIIREEDFDEKVMSLADAPRVKAGKPEGGWPEDAPEEAPKVKPGKPEEGWPEDDPQAIERSAAATNLLQITDADFAVAMADLEVAGLHQILGDLGVAYNRNFGVKRLRALVSDERDKLLGRAE